MDAPAAQEAHEYTHVVQGNRLTLLPDGPERLDALIALIDGARRSLRVLYYIYAPDASGRRVNAALIAAAARGVKVALIVDGFGSDTAKDEFFAPVEAAGVSMCRFAPRFGRRYLLRNHQKLALADAEDECPRIIVGGFNVEDDYFGRGADSWRDLDCCSKARMRSEWAGISMHSMPGSRRPRAACAT